MHIAMPHFGTEFLEGIRALVRFTLAFTGVSLSDAMVGTGYAIVDGGVGGFLLDWLYNA
jgi:hypothetical protein